MPPPSARISGAEDLLARIRALKPDTIDFLRKPFSAPELLARIERSLSRSEAREELRAQAEVARRRGRERLARAAIAPVLPVRRFGRRHCQFPDFRILWTAPPRANPFKSGGAIPRACRAWPGARAAA